MTGAWLVAHRNDPAWKWHYDYAFGKRPAEELYDLMTDPREEKNLVYIKTWEVVQANLLKADGAPIATVIGLEAAQLMTGAAVVGLKSGRSVRGARWTTSGTSVPRLPAVADMPYS